MKYFILSIFSFFFVCNVFAQKQANHWFFGENAGLDFTNANQNVRPIADISGQLSTIEGCASISDVNGNLLFYTDGRTVWDKNNTIMPHGLNLFGNASSTQSAIIVPKPGDLSIYYIFTVDAQEVIPSTSNKGLNVYTVDLNLNGGLGDLVNSSGNAVVTNLLVQPSSEKITAVLDANKTDFWVITLKINTFYAFKVSTGGVDASNPVTSAFPKTFIDRRGYLKVSPNGNFLATANMRQGLYFYDFNNATGIVSNDRELVLPFTNSNYGPYGIAFSALSKKLYVSSGSFDNTHTTNERLYQFDLNQTDLSVVNLTASRVLIHQYLNSRGALQLGPDGKIYRNIDSQSKLGVINNPDASGLDANYQHAAIDLGGNFSRQGLPPFIQSFFIADTQILNTCLGDVTKFLVNATEPIISMITDFGDGTATSTSLSPSHSYRSIGNYTASFTITTASETKTITKDFSISAVPTATTPPNWDAFDNNNDGFYSFDFSQKDSEILNGQDPNVFEVHYFTDIALTQSISRLYTNTTAYTAETIYANVVNKNNFNCEAATQFDINVFDNPNPAPPENIPDLEQCDDALDGDDTNGSATFDLTTLSTIILNGQSSTDFDVAYFTDEALTNPITNPGTFKNTTANEQIIYVSVTNKLNPTFVAKTSFKVVVHALPVITPVVTLKQCDIDTDGITDFNLTESNILINTQIPVPTFSYYLNLADAQVGDPTLALTNTDVFSNATATTIYTRVENSFGCFRIAQVDLLVSTTDIPLGFLYTLEICDDTEEDGFAIFDFSEATTAIKNIFPAGQNLAVSYYRNTEDALAERNTIDDTNYTNEVAYTQNNIVVRVDNTDNNECVGMGKHLILIVNSLPQFDLLESQFVCLNDLPLTVSVTNPAGQYDYVWRNADGAVIGNNKLTASITKGGEYTVTATTTNGTLCSKTKSITINESITATIENLNVVDDSDNNIIDVDITGKGIYEIALDNLNDFVPFAPLSSLPGNTHRFTHVVAGIHTVYIRDKNGCGLTIKQAVIIGFPHFLTPNGDGINDTWNVAGASLQPNSLVYIFDRFGKLIAKINPTGPGWDGTFNGRKLPTSDYWFTARLQDGRLRKGHFSLVRR